MKQYLKALILKQNFDESISLKSSWTIFIINLVLLQSFLILQFGIDNLNLEMLFFNLGFTFQMVIKFIVPAYVLWVIINKIKPNAAPFAHTLFGVCLFQTPFLIRRAFLAFNIEVPYLWLGLLALGSILFCYEIHHRYKLTFFKSLAILILVATATLVVFTPLLGFDI